jgi:hypothetical protein
VLGFVWLGVGLLVLLTFYLTGRRPELAALVEVAHESTDEPVKEPQ